MIRRLGAWVRDAIGRYVDARRAATDALDKMQRLDAPTADINQMLAEIAAGRLI